MKNKVVLFLLGYKGLKVLKSIIEDNSSAIIAEVVIGKDKNITNDYSKEISALCKASKINYSLEYNTANKVASYWIAIGWKKILNPTTDLKLLIIHDSLLPKYRGFAPLVSQLINGEKEVGASCIIANKNYDEGDILLQESFVVNYPIKIEAAIESMANIYVKICLNLVQLILSDQPLKAEPQDDSKATYSLWRDEEDYMIDWNSDSQKIKRLIDSVGTPYKGARTTLDGQLIVIHETIEIADLTIENRTAGKIIKFQNSCPIVVCGKGLLKISKASYLENGNSIFPLNKFRSRFS